MIGLPCWLKLRAPQTDRAVPLSGCSLAFLAWMCLSTLAGPLQRETLCPRWALVLMFDLIYLIAALARPFVPRFRGRSLLLSTQAAANQFAALRLGSQCVGPGSARGAWERGTNFYSDLGVQGLRSLPASRPLLRWLLRGPVPQAVPTVEDRFFTY